MNALMIAIGVVLIIAAVACFIGAIAQETVVLFGAAVVAGVVAGFLIDKGWHAYNVEFHNKHMAIYNDLVKQGFHVQNDNVYAKAPSTEADFQVGKCFWFFNTTKIDGVWRVTVPVDRVGKQVRAVSPQQLAKLAEVCP